MPSYVLNACKSFINYGIKIYGSTYDPCFTQGYINSKPNVSIIGSSCFIDYTNTYNISDLTFLKKAFKNTPVGTTFSFSSADYYDSYYEYTVDVSGVFSFESIQANDKLIIAGIQSGFTYLNNYKFYNSLNFIDPPQYTTTYTGGATAQNYIENNLTANQGKSFINIGIIGNQYGKEEYIEIFGSTLNTGKIKLDSVLKLKDNRELVYTTNTLQNENLSTTGITFTHYLRGNANPEILSKSRKQIGCYVLYDNSGNQIQCFENQNQLQAFLRTQFENSSYTAEWVPCSSCSRLSDNGLNAASSDKTIAFDGSVFLYMEEVNTVYIDGEGNYNLTYLYKLKSNKEGTSSLQITNSIDFTISTGFKIDLSNPSLKGFAVNIYLDSAKTVPMTENIYLLGIPGFDQSGLLYTKSETSAKKIYLEFVGPSVVNLEINVN